MRRIAWEYEWESELWLAVEPVKTAAQFSAGHAGEPTVGTAVKTHQPQTTHHQQTEGQRSTLCKYLLHLQGYVWRQFHQKALGSTVAKGSDAAAP